MYYVSFDEWYTVRKKGKLHFHEKYTSARNLKILLPFTRYDMLYDDLNIWYNSLHKPNIAHN